MPVEGSSRLPYHFAISCLGSGWGSGLRTTSTATQRSSCRRLRISFWPPKGWLPAEETVLDPFGGSGTVALEAQLSGRPALYADANPLARLITAAKTKPVDPAAAAALLPEIGRLFSRWKLEDVAPPWVVNVDLWYCAEAKHELASLRRAITEAAPGNLDEFVWAAFSSTARKSSRADPRFAVPVRCKPDVLAARATPEVWTLFANQFASNLERHRRLQSFGALAPAARCVGDDARALICIDSLGSKSPVALEDGSVGLVLTSPPYASAQKYVRAASLSLGWLGMTTRQTLKALENATIGREHFCKAALHSIPETGNIEADELIQAVAAVDRTRAAICAHYLIEMDAAVAEAVRVLKGGGKAVLVIGDNSVCGMPFPSSRFLADMFVRRGIARHVAISRFH